MRNQKIHQVESPLFLFLFKRLTYCAILILPSIDLFAAEAKTVQLDRVDVSATAFQYRQFDAVEITGSSILTDRSKETLPILVYTRKDIDRMQQESLANVVQALTSHINGFNLGMVGSAISESGPQAAAIHGLQNATLVLLNGRRMPGYSRATIGIDREATDLDIVPLGAVDRIEIMTDGASARYGSDAIAGVVNIVTTEKLKGGRFGASEGWASDGGGRQRHAYLSWGGGDFAATGLDWQLHASVAKEQGLRTNEREATSQVPFVGDPADNRYFAANFYGLTRYGWPATTNNRLASWGPIEPQAVLVNGQCSDGWVAIRYQGELGCWYQRYSGLSIYPDQERTHLMGTARLALSPDWALFTEGVFSQKQQTSDANPATNQYWYQSLGGGRWAFASPLPLGPDRARFTYDQHRLTLGVKGQWDGWQTQLGYIHGAQHGQREVAGPSYRLAGTALLQDKGLTEAELATAVADVSAETLAKLSNGLRLDFFTLDAGESESQSVDWVASKVLSQRDAGDVSIGLGVSWRKDRQQMATFDSSTLDERVPALARLYPAMDAAREVRAGFVELEVPVTPLLTMNGHMRNDVYSDVGSVTTGKVAFRYKPNKNWLLRGSVGSGFRAPDVLQLVDSTYYVSSTTNNGVATYHYYRGNPDAKPEKSLQQTVGVRWDPSPRWTLGGDYWRLHMRDQLFVPTQQFVSQFPEWRPLVTEVLPSGDVKFYLKPFNVGESWREGLDYDFQYRLPTEWGRLRVVLRGTHYLKAQSRRSPQEAVIDVLAQANGSNFDYVPKDKLSLQLAWERPTWAAWLTTNYLSGNTEYYNVWNASVGGPALEAATYEREVASYWTLDLGARYQPKPEHVFELKVGNLLNQYPPFRALSYPLQRPGVNANYGNYYGRTIQIGYEYKF